MILWAYAGTCLYSTTRRLPDTSATVYWVPTLFAEDETETGRRLDMLGYVVYLDKRLLSIARKKVLNSLYWFFSVDLDDFTNLLDLHRLGSLASRYGVICRFGRPFNAAIHAATRNLRSQVRIRFPAHTKHAIH